MADHMPARLNITDGRAQAQPYRNLVRAVAVIGVVADHRPHGFITSSTTFDAPYHIARHFASLDHLSEGRAGWNIITPSNPDAALNFGLDSSRERGGRYERAREFYDVVTGLWTGLGGRCAFIALMSTAAFSSIRQKCTCSATQGRISPRVHGPLNIAQPVQELSVIVQAGASEAGRKLASETAEAVFAAQATSSRAEVLRRRQRPHANTRPLARTYLILRVFVVIDVVDEAKGKTREEARQPHQLRQCHRASLSIALGHDASKFDPDGAADIPEKQCVQEQAFGVIARKRDDLTVRQLATRLGGLFRPCHGRHAEDHCRRNAGMSSKPNQRRLHHHRAVSAGRPRRFRHARRPELQGRGLFRHDYEGTTLRDHLDLPRPKNRFFEKCRSDRRTGQAIPPPA